MSNKNPNTKGILKNAEKKTKITIEKVENAIKEMIKDGTTINFNSLSVKTGVSKSFLYNNKELKMRIDSLREKQKPNIKKEKVTQDSKDVIIQSLQKRISDLENEIKILKKVQMDNLSKIYEEI